MNHASTASSSSWTRFDFRFVSAHTWDWLLTLPVRSNSCGHVIVFASWLRTVATEEPIGAWRQRNANDATSDRPELDIFQRHCPSFPCVRPSYNPVVSDERQQ